MSEWTIRRKGILERMMKAIMASKTRARTAVGMSDEFDIEIGLHQRSALSPLLFITVFDEVTKEAKDGVHGSWHMPMI